MLGIGVSITGIIGGIAAIVRGSKLESGKISNFFTELTRGGKNYQAELGVLLLDRSTMYVIGGVLLLFMIQYLILWILLSSSSRQASKTFLALNNWWKFIARYVSGSLESVVTTFLIMLILYAVLIFNDNSCSVKTIITRTCQLNVWFGNSWEEVVSIYSVGSFTYLCFACQKMDAIRTKGISPI